MSGTTESLAVLLVVVVFAIVVSPFIDLPLTTIDTICAGSATVISIFGSVIVLILSTTHTTMGPVYSPQHELPLMSLAFRC